MAVSMISTNSISFSNYDSASGGGSSGLLDFSAPSSGQEGPDPSAAPMPMDQSALAPMDQSPMAPMDPGMMPMDSFQSSAPMGDYSPPPQAAPGPSGGFDFVA